MKLPISPDLVPGDTSSHPGELELAGAVAGDEVPGEISSQAGACVRHMSIAYGQRGWK